MDKILGAVGKKFLAKLIGLIVIPLIFTLNKKFDLGMSSTDIDMLIGMIVTFIVGQTIADVATKGMTSSVAQAGALNRIEAAVGQAAPDPKSPPAQ